MPDLTSVGTRELVLVKKGHRAWLSFEQTEIVKKTFGRYITSCERHF